MTRSRYRLLPAAVFGALVSCQSAPDSSFQLQGSPVLDGEADLREEVRSANENALNDPEATPIFRESTPF